MKSIVSIKWAAPDIAEGVVVLPFSMLLAEDCGPTDEIAPPYEVNTRFWLTFEMVAKGQQSIEATLNTLVDGQRDSFGPISLGKLRESIITHVRKVDLTTLVHPAWADAHPYHYRYQ